LKNETGTVNERFRATLEQALKKVYEPMGLYGLPEIDGFIPYKEGYVLEHAVREDGTPYLKWSFFNKLDGNYSFTDMVKKLCGDESLESVTAYLAVEDNARELFHPAGKHYAELYGIVADVDRRGRATEAAGFATLERLDTQKVGYWTQYADGDYRDVIDGIDWAKVLPDGRKANFQIKPYHDCVIIDDKVTLNRTGKFKHYPKVHRFLFQQVYNGNYFFMKNPDFGLPRPTYLTVHPKGVTFPLSAIITTTEPGYRPTT